jgi:hypothetical protein
VFIGIIHEASNENISLPAAMKPSDRYVSFLYDVTQNPVLVESHEPDARVACTAMNPDDRPISFTMPVRRRGEDGKMRHGEMRMIFQEERYGNGMQY